MSLNKERYICRGAGGETVSRLETPRGTGVAATVRGSYMRILCLLSTAFLLMMSAVARSEDADSTVVQLAEDGYIELMNNYLAVKLKFSSETRDFKVKSAGNSYDIRLNAMNAIRIALNYRFISLSYGYFPRFIPGNNGDDSKGNSKAKSYSLNLNFRHWVQSLSYRKAEGFYLHNTADFIPDWTEGEDNYVQFPELVYTSIDGFTAYKLNPRFSFKALSIQTERQRKSAGSLMPFVSYNYYILDNRGALAGQNSSQKSNNLELLISMGYFYTLVLNESFYFSTGLAPGAGVVFTKQLTRSPDGEYTDHHHHPIYRLEVHGALGYDSRRLFVGAQLIASWARYNQNGPSSVITHDRMTYQVFAGYRFNAPGFLARLTDRLSGLI